MRKISIVNRIASCFLLTIAVFLFACSPQVRSFQKEKFTTAKNIPAKIERWEKKIESFELADKKMKPKKGSILFVGSSSIVKWENLNEQFPKKYILNRGFGGSQTDEVHYYAFRILFPYKPKQVVIYVGDNDIAAGKSPEEVFTDLKEFFIDIRYRLPKAKITFISIKPSPRRWHLMDKFNKTNALVEQYLKTFSNSSYVDIVKPMLMENGEPNPAYFLTDNLHMTPAGYDIWTKALRSHLK